MLLYEFEIINVFNETTEGSILFTEEGAFSKGGVQFNSIVDELTPKKQTKLNIDNVSNWTNKNGYTQYLAFDNQLINEIAWKFSATDEALIQACIQERGI